MDIIVINNKGVLKTSPFHIRFSMFKTLNPVNSEIKVYVNENYIPIQVKLTKEGDIYFPNSDSNDKFTPSAETIKLFNLNSGKNKIEFELFTTFFYSSNTMSASIYLWDSSNKIVISDIDGTITRSDVLGVILPTIGIDWTQKNIVKLYRDIERNGYKIIYLTSRAIGESLLTRNYLQSLSQGFIFLI
jgi:phosphatidate phosphatase LPIN